METSVKGTINTTIGLPQLWGSIVPMQIFGAYAFYDLFSGGAPWWWWIATLVGYICLLMVGISAGYHRLFCHRGFTVNKITKRIVLLFGLLAGQGSPIMWIAIHRGYHHKYADTPRDLHSPTHGFWHSYMGWMFKYPKISIRSATSLLRDPDMVFAHKHYIKILWAANIMLALINVDLWLYLLAFPAFITLHLFLAQTSFTHLRWAGYRNYDVKDDSVNVPWLFPLILGEAWHNNHHGNGHNPNYRRRWWEIDPTFWIIQLIRNEK